MNHMCKNNIEEIREDLKIQNPDSFLGVEFYKHLNDKNVEVGRKSWELDEYLFPLNKQFLNPLNPVFIDKIYNLEAIELVKFLMVRDGVYSVVDFFNRFPTPSGIKCILIIPENFAQFVPNEWQKNVEYYYYGILNTNESSDKNNILYLTGICSHNSCSLEQIERLIDVIKKQHISVVRACIDFKEDYFGTEKERVKHFEIFKALYRDTDVAVEFYKWNEFEKMKQKGIIFDLNDGDEIIFDNYLVNCLLANGHLPSSYDRRSVKEEDLVVQLTEKHGIVISSSRPKIESSSMQEMYKMKGLLSNGRDIYNSDMIHYIKDIIRKDKPKFKWFSIV